jgi:hypothetical protein
LGRGSASGSGRQRLTKQILDDQVLVGELFLLGRVRIAIGEATQFRLNARLRATRRGMLAFRGTGWPRRFQTIVVKELFDFTCLRLRFALSDVGINPSARR